ncbi:MAG: hypothetical protein C5B59_12535 [Bacteroidetes bacterium]|nr:MAG: hypothetical protein C5B59_12535 [Bacteroidota bacterium]
MKKLLLIARKLLILILALQLLNLSICSEAYWDDYDFAYNGVNTYDPTETVVEWLVEMKFGQQNAFSYDNGIDKKIITKSFHWQTDLQRYIVSVGANSSGNRQWPFFANDEIQIGALDILSPPPERV